MPKPKSTTRSRGNVVCHCQHCGGEFRRKPSDVKNGKGKFCSKACRDRSQISLVTCTCQHCGKEFRTCPSRIKNGRGRYCSLSCRAKSPRKTLPPEERFAKYVGTPLADGCVPWMGHKNSLGYGQFGMNGKNVRAHRYAWEQVYGPIPDGLCVCHTCDNPPCINVEHLFLGTITDNIADKVAKERQPRGESQGTAKLTEQEVIEIRARVQAGEIQKGIASEYGVCPGTISFIVRGDTWKHV